MATQYDGIFYNQSRVNGQMRMSESGLGWRSSSQKETEPVLIPAEELNSVEWSRGARGWMLKFFTNTLGIIQFDGFQSTDLESLENALKRILNIHLDHREHSTRGWNWGHTEFERSELVFNIASRPSLEVPYKNVTNANVVGKSEVAIEFGLETGERVTAGDELVEIRFFVPGTVEGDGEVESEGAEDVKMDVEEKKPEEGQEGKDEDGEEEPLVFNAANVFCQELKDRAELGLVRGDELVGIEDILFLTPRGRYNVDFYRDSFRLRGKSYDYKLRYPNIQRIFVLPKSDDAHNLVIVQLEPPLMQGQTRYPFLVTQFPRDENLEVKLNIEKEEFEKTFKGRLEETYEEPAFRVVSNLFKGLSQRKITFTGSYVSALNLPSVECTHKTANGSLYVLEKAFLFVSRAPLFIPYSDIKTVTLSRVGGVAISAARTFDFTVTLSDKKGTFAFTGIEKEEQQSIEDYMQSKNIKVINDILAEKKRLEQMDKALNELDSDEDDEDFDAEEESDIAEEFDSDASESDDFDDEDEEMSDSASKPSKAVERGSSSGRSSKRAKDE